MVWIRLKYRKCVCDENLFASFFVKKYTALNKEKRRLEVRLHVHVMWLKNDDFYGIIQKRCS